MEQGRQLELPCVTHKKDAVCAWMLNGTYKLPITGRFEYLSNSPKGDCSLVIYNLNYPRDNGLWECQALGKAEDQSPNWPKTSVVVLVKPSAPRFNDIFTFNCRVLIMTKSLPTNHPALFVNPKVETRCLRCNGFSMATTLHRM